MQLKEKLEKELDSTDVNEIFGFQSMNLSSIIGYLKPSSSKDYNVINLPRTIKKSIKDLAKGLSMSETIVATMSTIITLSSQSGVILTDHHHPMERWVTTFFRKVCLRRELAELFLNKSDSSNSGGDVEASER